VLALQQAWQQLGLGQGLGQVHQASCPRHQLLQELQLPPLSWEVLGLQQEQVQALVPAQRPWVQVQVRVRALLGVQLEAWA